jgi:hypothetical protein
VSGCHDGAMDAATLRDLQAPLACAGVTMRSVATAMGIDIVSAELRAIGVQDMAKLGELTERYCVVGQSLAHIPSISVIRTEATANRAH